MGIRERLLVALVVGTCLVGLTGCTRTATGSPEWVSNDASKSVDESDAEGLLLDPDDAGDVVGAELLDVLSTDSPLDEGDLNDCEVLDPVGLASFLGDHWDGFSLRKLDDQPADDENSNYIVTEAAVVYADADAAKASFESTSKLVQGCDGDERETSGVSWRSTTEDSNDHSITWIDEQTNLTPGEWQCSGDERRRNNVVLRVLVCSGDGDGAGYSAAIADEMSNRVWELSSPGR